MFFIELEPVFNNEGFSRSVDFTLDMSDCYFNGGFPFTDAIHITGEVKNSTDIVSLVAKAEFTLNLTCDRCAADFSRTFIVPLEHVLVTELNDDDNDEFIVVDSFHYDLEPLVREDVVLALPMKVLCREDCVGICHRCGKDLNDGPCDCGRDYDPRWDALQQLLEDDQ
jgi:uncharacterized protein